jgi:hypothetical protein
MDQLQDKFSTLSISMEQLTRHVKFLKNKSKSKLKSHVLKDDSIRFSKPNEFKSKDDKYVSEYPTNIPDTPKHMCFIYGRLWFRSQVNYASIILIKSIPKKYQIDTLKRPIFICKSCGHKFLQEKVWTCLYEITYLTT